MAVEKILTTSIKLFAKAEQVTANLVKDAHLAAL